MKQFIYWFIGFIVVGNIIDSCNSSNQYKQVSRPLPESRMPHPTTPIWEAYTYVGGCYCPYNLDSRGYECGERSAWSRTGGAEPECYWGDRYAKDYPRY